MAKKRKKKSSGDMAAPCSPPTCTERSADAGIREVENGYIVRVSSEGLGKGKNRNYESKTFIATDHPSALRIASQGFGALAKKVGKGKKGGSKKRVSTKRS